MHHPAITASASGDRSLFLLNLILFLLLCGCFLCLLIFADLNADYDDCDDNYYEYGYEYDGYRYKLEECFLEELLYVLERLVECLCDLLCICRLRLSFLFLLL